MVITDRRFLTFKYTPKIISNLETGLNKMHTCRVETLLLGPVCRVYFNILHKKELCLFIQKHLKCMSIITIASLYLSKSKLNCFKQTLTLAVFIILHNINLYETRFFYPNFANIYSEI